MQMEIMWEQKPLWTLLFLKQINLEFFQQTKVQKGCSQQDWQKKEKDATKKAALLAESQQKIAIAKAAKDETMKWDDELVKIKGGGGVNQAAVDAGPTNPQIEGLKNGSNKSTRYGRFI